MLFRKAVELFFSCFWKAQIFAVRHWTLFLTDFYLSNFILTPQDPLLHQPLADSWILEVQPNCHECEPH